jgi:glyoxylase-like metal-dependent hydrolase (beta-lactamase superfamily II)
MGCSNKHTDLDKELKSAGCKPGNLKLIVLKYGDFDHTGNAAYLRIKFGTEIAMDDLEAANASVEKLKSLKINTVYPGHVKPFSMELFIKKNR